MGKFGICTGVHLRSLPRTVNDGLQARTLGERMSQSGRNRAPSSTELEVGEPFAP
jgi:hypothetical protein